MYSPLFHSIMAHQSSGMIFATIYSEGLSTSKGYNG